MAGVTAVPHSLHYAVLCCLFASLSTSPAHSACATGVSRTLNVVAARPAHHHVDIRMVIRIPPRSGHVPVLRASA